MWFMMNRYIRIIMKPTSRGGVISVRASFELDNIKVPFENVTVKIDTGCSVSTIPLAAFQTVRLCKRLKHADVSNNAEYLLSYGVETGGRKHARPVSYDDKMACTALKFKHSISNFKINGVDISAENIYVNYDRTSNILIGMDILKNWDIHIGKSMIPEETGKTIFLACPYDKLNEDYFKELERTFGILTETAASMSAER